MYLYICTFLQYNLDQCYCLTTTFMFALHHETKSKVLIPRFACIIIGGLFATLEQGRASQLLSKFWYPWRKETTGDMLGAAVY